MSALLDQKYDKLFGLLDTNGNGVVARDDFDHMVDQVLAAFGEPRTGPKGSGYAGEMAGYWNALREAADTDGDGQISREEFRQALHQVSGDFASLVEPLYRACFRLADRDDDGLVSKAEFVAAETAIGVSEQDAGAAYDRLTEQGGQLTVEVVVNALSRFYRDDTASGADSHLFFGAL